MIAGDDVSLMRLFVVKVSVRDEERREANLEVFSTKTYPSNISTQP